jgi:hypothetical protein
MALTSQEKHEFSFSGQASVWGNGNLGNDLPLWLGARYIPQGNYKLTLENNQLIDFEVAANINGSTGMSFFDSLSYDGTIKPYRAWARYSGNQFELRLGLQKINFGSASMLRPLMWFDQMDPRDPLQLTDGVWGLLGRYYFLNNANIWLWGLYGNEGPKTWEVGNTTKNTPEFGGRFQMPVSRGEAALSFHHRTVDTRPFAPFLPAFEKLPESRYGFDGKWDIGIGIWLEAAWIQKHRDLGPLTHQEIINLGADYTLGIGNGLNIIGEHLIFSPDQKAFEFANPVHFSGVSASYPIGMFDNINAIVYYDWTNENIYNFINWKKDLNRISLYVMAFWNPETFQLPQQTESGALFSGKGMQIMLVYNH